MPKSISSIVPELIQMIQTSSDPALTIPWATMYEVCDRARFKDSFLDELKKKMRARNYHLSYGDNYVVLCPDTGFALPE